MHIAWLLIEGADFLQEIDSEHLGGYLPDNPSIRHDCVVFAAKISDSPPIYTEYPTYSPGSLNSKQKHLAKGKSLVRRKVLCRR